MTREPCPATRGGAAPREQNVTTIEIAAPLSGMVSALDNDKPWRCRPLVSRLCNSPFAHPCAVACRPGVVTLPFPGTVLGQSPWVCLPLAVSSGVNAVVWWWGRASHRTHTHTLLPTHPTCVTHIGTRCCAVCASADACGRSGGLQCVPCSLSATLRLPGWCVSGGRTL
jgi:hypothetical protein